MLYIYTTRSTFNAFSDSEVVAMHSENENWYDWKLQYLIDIQPESVRDIGKIDDMFISCRPAYDGPFRNDAKDRHDVEVFNNGKEYRLCEPIKL